MFGGASGLGGATAPRLAAAGARVTIADLDAVRGQALADEIESEFVLADVTDPDQVQEAVARGTDLGRRAGDQRVLCWNRNAREARLPFGADPLGPLRQGDRGQPDRNHQPCGWPALRCRATSRARTVNAGSARTLRRSPPSRAVVANRMLNRGRSSDSMERSGWRRAELPAGRPAPRRRPRAPNAGQRPVMRETRRARPPSASAAPACGPCPRRCVGSPRQSRPARAI